ncbi:MAG: recombinase family protein [Actinomycetota bacterium]|nr:recombinase family protein [Actinomycetota bacterium]
MPAVGKPLRAALYARVSTSAQVNTTSLATQLSNCRARAKDLNCTAAGEYVDAGASGADASRPELDRLMGDIRAGAIDVVLVHKLDRIGRSLLNLLTLLGELDALDVQLVSISESFDTRTPVGRLQLSILASVAEFERERIRERIMDGLYARASEGGFVSSRPPFGYTTLDDPRGRGQLLAIDESQAVTIRRIHELMVVERVGTQSALQTLNDENRLADTGRPWTRGGLLAWIRRKGPQTAGGAFRWGGIDIPIPAILTAEQVTQWRAWLVGTGQPGQRSHSTYLLSGAIESSCGAVFTGRHARTKTKDQAPIYICPGRSGHRAGDPQRCDDTNLRMSTTDGAVWSEIVRVLTDPAALAGLVAAGREEAVGTDRVTAASTRVETIQRQIVNEYQGAIDAGFDADMARMMVAGRQRELAESKTELTRLAKARGRTNTSAADAAKAETLRERVEDLSDTERRSVVELLGIRVTVMGYEDCGACVGRGMVRVPGEQRPVQCDQCYSMRRLPVLSVTITVPQAMGAVIDQFDALAG